MNEGHDPTVDVGRGTWDVGETLKCRSNRSLGRLGLSSQRSKILLESFRDTTGVRVLKLRSAQRGFLLRNHHERALAQHARHPGRTENREVVVVDTQVTQSHPPHHARLNGAG